MKSNIYLLALSVMAFLPIFIPLYCKTGPSQAKHVSRCAVSLHAKRLLVFFMLSKDQWFFGLKPISQIFSLILETRNAEGQRLKIFYKSYVQAVTWNSQSILSSPITIFKH